MASSGNCLLRSATNSAWQCYSAMNLLFTMEGILTETLGFVRMGDDFAHSFVLPGLVFYRSFVEVENGIGIEQAKQYSRVA